jgi:flagellar assembly protein FliH
MVIPKEQQSAYQRWEMASFDRRPAPRAEPVAPVAPAEPQLALPTEAEIEAIRQQAFAEAYTMGLTQGREQGYQEGHAQGYADGAKAGQIESEAELEHLRGVAAGFAQAVAEADETIASDVLELALRLARGMVRTSFNVRPELIVPVVQEALGHLPVLQQPAVLTLHPEDALLVRQAMQEELTKGGWRIVEDTTIVRGGCKVETGSNQIDAQAQARWHRLTHSLGANIDWMGQ